MEDKIFSLIDRIRIRPGMYLGSLSLASLWHFIDGYSFALNDLDYVYDRFFPLNFSFFTEFTIFIIGLMITLVGIIIFFGITAEMRKRLCLNFLKCSISSGIFKSTVFITLF